MNEKLYLRELAKQVVELANLPIMQQRIALWKLHNTGAVTVPPVLMETWGFTHEFLPPLKTVSATARLIEAQLLDKILNYQTIGDDKVVTPEIEIYHAVGAKLFNIEMTKHAAKDDTGRELGYAIEYPITDLERDLKKLGKTTWNYDAAATQTQFDEAQELVGDILTIKKTNNSINWFLSISAHVVFLMGMQNMFLAMMESPEAIQELLTRITNDLIAYIKWQENENLLTLNNGNNYAGSGSYGFSDQLPQPGFNGKVRSCDIWGNLNSQETVGVAPKQFISDFYPHYEKLASIFGLTYFGCCEPVDVFWDAGLKNLPHLRKVSVSPWCDDQKFGEALRGTGIIFCCKPSPNFIGVSQFDRDGLYNDAVNTIKATRGVPLEFSFRDIYTQCGDLTRAKQAVQVVRDAISAQWQG
jgi:hypothetical protein